MHPPTALPSPLPLAPFDLCGICRRSLLEYPLLGLNALACLVGLIVAATFKLAALGLISLDLP